jgi:hypothetical protein
MKVSIIVPAWNRPAMLKRLFDSLEAQTDTRWEIAVGNDNSSNPQVHELAYAFCRKHNGFYAQSDVKDEDRAKTVRAAELSNFLTPYTTGEILHHCADDEEFADPKAVGLILQFFEGNADKYAGYVGIGYRMADWQSGHIYSTEEVEAQFKALGWTAKTVLTPEGIVDRRLQDWIPYGEKLKRVFAILDSAQSFYRRELFPGFPTDPEYWMGADAHLLQIVSDWAGGFYPIADPLHRILKYSNLNEGSLTIQGSAEKAIATR